MKSMLKSELAREAGVSRRTLNNWCRQLLPPKIVQFMKDTFCI